MKNFLVATGIILIIADYFAQCGLGVVGMAAILATIPKSQKKFGRDWREKYRPG